MKNNRQNEMILKMQEEERQRIARDLHDTVAQNLAHLTYRLEMCSLLADSDTDRLKDELTAANAELRRIIEEMRTVIVDIRPMSFDDLSFKDAIERLLIRLNHENRFFMKKDIDDIPIECDNVKTNIFRIVQECVSNAIKHSGGSEISVSCKMTDDGFYSIHIGDDGKGFIEQKELQTKHFGLSVLRERVQLLEGEMKLESAAGEGTNIYIRVPLLYKG